MALCNKLVILGIAILSCIKFESSLHPCTGCTGKHIARNHAGNKKVLTTT